MRTSILIGAALVGLALAPGAAAEHDESDDAHECTVFEAWVYPDQAQSEKLFEVWLYTGWLENDCRSPTAPGPADLLP